MLLFRNSLLKISQQQLFFFSIQKGEPLLRKLHTEEAGSICRESSNHGRPESSQQRSSTFLPHQGSINIHEAFVGTLRGSLIPRFQDIRRDRHAPTCHSSKSTCDDNRQGRKLRRILNPLCPHHLFLDQLVDSEPCDTSRAISHQRQGSSLVQTANSTRSIHLNRTVHHSGVLRFSTSMTLNLQEALYTFCRSHDNCGRKRRKSTSDCDIYQTERCILVFLE
mmetsp:Transcript_13357/g.36605  ORF Transcript_13357/g.36605 Transcript_13357/m.36605 type:complete len:222 (+) Transcript_13357:306-971(+)